MSERSGSLADDPYSGRHPTSHERLSGLPWDASYQGGPAPWDIGRPQPAVVRLASEGGFTGAVLDAGCGTGENALHLASLGLPVLGVDVAETALATAREKADDRGIRVDFAAADALQLERLGRTFQTVLDCGLFHTFDADERPKYALSLASDRAPWHPVRAVLRRRWSRQGPAPRQSRRAASNVHSQSLEGARHRSGPASNEISRSRRRTGLARDNQTHIDVVPVLLDGVRTRLRRSGARRSMRSRTGCPTGSRRRRPRWHRAPAGLLGCLDTTQKQHPND